MGTVFIRNNILERIMKISEMPPPYNAIRKVVLYTTGELVARDGADDRVCSLDHDSASILIKDNPLEIYQGPDKFHADGIILATWTFLPSSSGNVEQ